MQKKTEHEINLKVSLKAKILKDNLRKRKIQKDKRKKVSLEAQDSLKDADNKR